MNEGLLILALSMQAAAGSGRPAGQETSAAPTGSSAATKVQPGTPAPVVIDKRIAGILPNYRSADGTRPFQPIGPRRKFMIGLKDSVDWPIYMLSAQFAGLGQLTDSNSYLGQGAAGFARRYWRSYADWAVGNMMAESLLPILLKEDPRYFLHVTGTKKHRLAYAATRVLITRTDSGGRHFNFSEWCGNAAAVAISNIYYADTRTAPAATAKLLTQVGTDAASNILKEFWPDIKRKVFKRRGATPTGTALSSPPGR